MASKLEDKFESFFKELEDLAESKSINKMEGFVHEALKFFELIRSKLTSENEEERKEATELAKKLQDKLMEHSQKAFKAAGMNEEELKSFLQQPTNFSEDEWKAFEKAQGEIADYQKTLLKNFSGEKKGPQEFPKKV